MNSEKEILKKTLLSLVKSEDGMVISLNGIWGIGKTYFWNECAKVLDKKKYAYISLFGKNSITDIRNDIFLQISTTNTIINKIKGNLGGSRILGADVGSMLTLLESKDLNQTVIAIDDLERLSNNLSIMDVMGLISELKEQKKCKIILISNIEQIKESDNLNSFLVSEFNEKASNTRFSIKRTNNESIFEKYSEKIIDYTFTYSPTIEENFSYIKDDLGIFESEHILLLLSRTNYDKKNFNIRLMNKLSRDLKLFNFLGKEIEKEILNSISTYIFEKVYSKSIDNSIFRRKDISPLYFKINDILKLGFINNKEDFLKEVIFIQQELNNTIKDKEFVKHTESIVEKYKYDVSYGEIDFANELYSKIKNNIERVYYLLGHNTLYYYTNTLLPDINKTKKDEYLNLWIEIAKKRIDSVFERIEDPTKVYSNDYLNPFNGNAELMEYIQSKRVVAIKEKTQDNMEVINVLTKLRNQSGWTQEDENYLSSIPPSLHEEYIQASSKYLELIHLFCLSLNRFSGSKPFLETYNNFVAALTNLENNQKYKIKIRRLLKELGESKE